MFDRHDFILSSKEFLFQIFSFFFFSLPKPIPIRGKTIAARERRQPFVTARAKISSFASRIWLLPVEILKYLDNAIEKRNRIDRKDGIFSRNILFVNLSRRLEKRDGRFGWDPSCSKRTASLISAASRGFIWAVVMKLGQPTRNQPSSSRRTRVDARSAVNTRTLAGDNEKGYDASLFHRRTIADKVGATEPP